MGFSRQRTSQTFRKLTRIPYRKNYRTRAVRSYRSILSQGGVPGGATRMSPHVPVVAEVKFRDVPVASTAGTGDWELILNNALAGITQSAGNSGRIGRSIKIVGITYRISVNFASLPQPYSIDFGIDRQANSAATPIVDIYNGSAHTSLPNPVYERRFKFMKRLEYKDPNLNNTYQCGTIRCSQVVNFSASTGAITDMEDANLFVSFACAGPVAAGTVTGSVRINYIDN